MTKDQIPSNETPTRAPYKQPVVIELDLAMNTDGKYSFAPGEGGTQIGPS